MTDELGVSRRRYLQTASVLAAGAIAGCSGSGDGGGGDIGETVSDVPSEVDDYLDGANNYQGLADRTGSDAVTVDVGVGENGYAFGPAAVQVSTGTTVTWKWTGTGGAHNVVASDGTFDSGNATVNRDPFEHSFEGTDVFQYYCEPHEMSGMKGAVVVVE